MRHTKDPEFRWLYCRYVDDTPRSFKVTIDGETAFLPTSQCKNLGKANNGMHKFLVPTWLLEKNGWMIHSEPVDHSASDGDVVEQMGGSAEDMGYEQRDYDDEAPF